MQEIIIKELKGALHFVKIPFLVSILLCGVGFLFGFGVSLLSNEIFPDIVSSETNELSQLSVFGILKNNLICLFIMLLGVGTLGIPSVVNLFVNGSLLGIIIGSSLKIKIPISYILLLILPHGVFEYLGMFLASSVGLAVAYRLIKYFQGSNNILTHSECIGLLKIAFLSVVLVTIAAFIEGNITKAIALNLIGIE